MSHKPVHSPPTPGVNDEPLAHIAINREWVGHVMGLFSEAASQDYWLTDQIDGEDKSIQILDILAKGTSVPFPPLSVRVMRTTTQSIPTATLTTTVFDTEIYDVGDLFDIGLPDRIQLSEVGVWAIGAEVRWDLNLVGIRQLQLHEPGGIISVSKHVQPTSTRFDMPISGIFRVTVPTSVRLRVQQTSGVPLNILPLSTHAISLWGHFLGPI